MPRRITYAYCRKECDGRYVDYADRLQQELGGKSFLLTQAFADHCSRNMFCPDGGASVIFAGDEKSYMEWDKSDTRVFQRVRASGLDETWKQRWRNLIRFANRVHETKRKLRAVRKVTRVQKPLKKAA